MMDTYNLVKSDNPDFSFTGKGRALVNVNTREFQLYNLGKKARAEKDAEIVALKSRVEDLSTQLEDIISLIRKQPVA